MEQLGPLLTQARVAVVLVHIPNQPLMLSLTTELGFVLLWFSFDVGMIMLVLIDHSNVLLTQEKA